MGSWFFALSLLVTSPFPQQASAPTAIRTPAFEAERQKANQLFLDGRALEALPLYEHLEKLDPNHAVFAERRAAGLIAESATVSSKAKANELMHQAYGELLRAQKLGDNSAYVLTLLEKISAMFADKTPIQQTDSSPKGQLMRAGEAAFARSDYATALKAYSEIAESNPKFYEAALYAGDSCFRLHDFKGADRWFTKAIAIEPNTETAYRYWGDALMADNRPDEAKDKFIEAIVAQPYQRGSWVGLSQWAQRTHNTIEAPAIQLPALSGDGSVPETYRTEDGTGRSVWAIYLMSRAKYRSDLRPGKAPGSGHYRHSLQEEAVSLELALADLKTKSITPEKLDPSLKALQSLEASHLLEPWILLHAADAEVSQDYNAYRDANRQQLHRFIAQVDLHTPAH